MVPAVVLTFLPTKHPTINNKTTTTNNNNGGTTASNFGVYQPTSVGSSEISIRTLVPDSTSTEPYRKVLVAKLFLQQMLPLSTNSSISFSDLMTTVAFYFGINTESTEREVASAA